jgi:hypothetical protein
MIRDFYDNWAGTRTGLFVNIFVFLTAIIMTSNMIAWTLIAFGFFTLAVNWYGISQGWNIENLEKRIRDEESD